MSEKREHKSMRRRTQVKELLREQKELSRDEQERVKGGRETLAIIPSRQDGSNPGV
ncbi:MAG TPA: hypothetical protein VGB73_19355 [Pyrinomonadaceae bacterium]|jgi:hypothetical protein